MLELGTVRCFNSPRPVKINLFVAKLVKRLPILDLICNIKCPSETSQMKLWEVPDLEHVPLDHSPHGTRQLAEHSCLVRFIIRLFR